MWGVINLVTKDMLDEYGFNHLHTVQKVKVHNANNFD